MHRRKWNWEVGVWGYVHHEKLYQYASFFINTDPQYTDEELYTQKINFFQGYIKILCLIMSCIS